MKKITKAWCPKSPTGILWENWINKNKRKVVAHLNADFYGWRDEGYTVVRVEIREVKP